MLGDGYIGAHDRTEVLRIACNLNNPGFIERYSLLVESLFDKTPSVKKRKISNCVDIVMYQKGIAERLGLQTGAKRTVLICCQNGLKMTQTTKLDSFVVCLKPTVVMRNISQRILINSFFQM